MNILRGSFEWQGAWSDNSDMWTKYPYVKAEMGIVSGFCVRTLNLVASIINACRGS